jgi:hypothetical protein
MDYLESLIPFLAGFIIARLYLHISKKKGKNCERDFK